MMASRVCYHILNSIRRKSKSQEYAHVSNPHIFRSDTPVVLLVDDEIDGKRTLMPYVVRRDTSSLSQDVNELLTWDKIYIPVVVKDNWTDALKQAASYGRSVLEETGRWYSMAIAYHCTKREVRFYFFLRMGMWITPALPITETTGFSAIVQGLRLSDITGRQIRDHHVYINPPSSDGDGSWCVAEEILCRRVSFVGPATYACRLRCALPPSNADNAMAPFNILSLNDNESSFRTLIDENSVDAEKSVPQVGYSHLPPVSPSVLGERFWNNLQNLGSEYLSDEGELVLKPSWSMGDHGKDEISVLVPVRGTRSTVDTVDCFTLDDSSSIFTKLGYRVRCDDFPSAFSDNSQSSRLSPVVMPSPCLALWALVSRRCRIPFSGSMAPLMES